MDFEVIDEKDKENLIGLEENLINEFLEYNVELSDEDKEEIKDLLLLEYEKLLERDLNKENNSLDDKDLEDKEEFHKTTSQYKDEKEKSTNLARKMLQDELKKEMFENRFLKEMREYDPETSTEEDLTRIRIYSLTRIQLINNEERRRYLNEVRYPNDLLSRINYNVKNPQEKFSGQKSEVEERKIQTQLAREKRKQERAERKRKGAERRKRIKNGEYEAER